MCVIFLGSVIHRFSLARHMLFQMGKKHFESFGDDPKRLRPSTAELDRGTYTLAEAAKRLGLSLRATRKAAASGQIAAVQIGRRWLVFKDDLEALLSSRRPKGGDM